MAWSKGCPEAKQRRHTLIRAIMFDLDGTLVQSEKLKAQSYAIAAQRILGLPEPDPRAIEAYREIVGRGIYGASLRISRARTLAL